jgi:uncharacterized protein YerC
MARLNKHPLTNKQVEKLFTQLSTSVSRLSASKTDKFLSELLGPEEKIMLAKRLGAIILLSEGGSLYKVSKVLKISTATADRLKNRIDKGEFEELISLVKSNRSDYKKILETLDSVLHLGGVLPHYVGLDRYKFLKKQP